MSSAGSVTSPSCSVFKRLPPNPRRRKIPLEQRKRVVRACDSCNVRRIKCSGTQPCSQCTSGSRTCEFAPKKAKIKDHGEKCKELEERCLILQRCLADAVPSEKNREALLSKWGRSKVGPGDFSDVSSRNGEEEQERTGDGRILQDPYGHARYMGESSGSAFMDRLREFVAKVLPFLPDKSGLPFVNSQVIFTSLLGRYHTHDSKPLLLPEVDPFQLPDAAHISKMLAVFRFFGQDETEATFGGIYYWGDLFELETQALKYVQCPEISDIHILANLNAIWALACQYDPSLAPQWEAYPGETYFARAKFLLGNPMEDARPENMRILCLMGHFLLGIYRRDAAYLYIGLASRIAVIHGLHKGWTGGAEGEGAEQMKREFWNTTILDKWLSCLMGRPAMIPEDAIDVSLPFDIPGSCLPPAAGLLAHVQLSIIMDGIVNKIYSTTSAGQSISTIMPGADASIEKLSAWFKALPPSLQLQAEGGSDRARLMLHMMYNQLLILTTRPFLFVAIKQAVAARYVFHGQRRSYSSHLSYLTCCAAAARWNAQLTRQLVAANQASVFSTLDFHYAFTAAITLQLTRLIPEATFSNDPGDVSFLEGYLYETGDRGNESAGDCARMVMEFGAVLSRLLDPATQPSNNVELPVISGMKVADQNSQLALMDKSQQPNEFAASGSAISIYSNLNFNITGEGSAAFDEVFAWFHDMSY